MPKVVKGGWDTGALIRYLEGRWLQLGLDQSTFLTRAGISASWLSNLRSDANRTPALAALAKLRETYNISADTLLDILEGSVSVDDHGQLRR